MMDFTDTLKRNLELSARCYLVETENEKLRDALGQAWEAINLLGAPDTAVGFDPYERGYCQAIKDAMAEIEKLGGQNPAARP